MEKILEIFPKEERVHYLFQCHHCPTLSAGLLDVLTFNFSSWRNSGILTFNSSLALAVDTKNLCTIFWAENWLLKVVVGGWVFKKIAINWLFFSFQVSEAGVHRPHVGGIHGRSNDGAYSLVLAGGFEDEVVCHSCKQWSCCSNASNVCTYRVVFGV